MGSWFSDRLTTLQFLSFCVTWHLHDGRESSLRSWRDFVRECFCFGSEAVNASGLVKSRVEFPPAQISGVFLIMRSPVHANFGLAESTETSIKC